MTLPHDVMLLDESMCHFKIKTRRFSYIAAPHMTVGSIHQNTAASLFVTEYPFLAFIVRYDFYIERGDWLYVCFVEGVGARALSPNGASTTRLSTVSHAPIDTVWDFRLGRLGCTSTRSSGFLSLHCPVEGVEVQ